MQVGKQHFLTLDGLRGIAAILVLVGHASEMFLGRAYIPRTLLAVQFFFMLSGFVVAYAYERKLLTGMAPTEFIRRRIIRLYPMILLGALVGSVAFAMSSGFNHPAGNLVRLLFASVGIPCVVCAGGEANFFPTNPPGWSLFFEMLAYLLYAALIRWASTKCLMAVTGVLMVGTIYVAVLYTDHVPFRWHFVDALGSFGAGVLLYRWRVRRAYSLRGANLFVLGIILTFLCTIPRSVGPLPDAIAILIAFPALILAGSSEAATTEHKMVSNWLGRLSYPLYIVHWPILVFSKLSLQAITPQAAMVAACVFSLAVATVATVLYDEPVRKFLSGRGRNLAAI